MTPPGDCIQGIIIRHPPTTTSDQPPPEYLLVTVLKSALSDQGWAVSPLSAKLGIPLKIRPLQQLSESRTVNFTAQLLMLVPDPEDEEFGESIFDDEIKGDVLVVRADRGSDLAIRKLKAVVWYVREELVELREFKRAQYEDPKAKAREIAGLITKEEFDARRKRS